MSLSHVARRHLFNTLTRPSSRSFTTTMAQRKDTWSADQYSKFLKDRTRPSTDLLAHVPNASPKRVVDIGCGPGNSTAVLAERYPNAKVSGFDTSPDMIRKAKETLPNVDFEVADLTSYKPDQPVDVLFSNAVFQWLPNGRRIEIVTQLLNHLAPGGSLAFQIPYNLNEPSHALMREVAAMPNKPWTETLKQANIERDQFPSPTEIWDGLKPLCADLDIWQTTYMHVMENHEGIVEWVKGTGLRPYVDPLDENREESSPALEAPSDEGPPSKRQRGFIARQATRNEASLGMIVNILRRIEGKIDDGKETDKAPPEAARILSTALRPFNPKSPANSSEVLGVPSFLARRDTIVETPSDPNPAISFSAHQVLFWPAIQAALPESVKLMCQMNGPTYSTRLEAARPKLPHSSSVDMSSEWLSKLSIAMLKELSDVYFTTFNLATPILDQKTYFQRTLGVAIDGNFGICIESCIVLVVMALGLMGQKALREARFASTPVSTPYPSEQEDEMPGLDFFNEARKRFGFLMCEQDLQACQFYLLSGLFYAEALRPLDWWSMLSKASACSAFFWNNVSRDRDEWMLDMQSRLFWITSMFEAVLSQELNLPPSNSLQLEEHIALPKFISARDIASFGSFRYPDPTADYPTEPVEDELIRQLEQWRERLPPMLQFDPKAPLTHAESPSDALVTAWLHARYFVARYHIGRPLLHRALERPSSLTEGHLRKCRDAINAVLAWASVIQVTNSMRSCNPLKFFVCSQIFGQICVVFALSVSPYPSIREIASDVDKKWTSFALGYLENCAFYSPAIEQDFKIAKVLCEDIGKI
ncbi:unnamed protein product [Fusarium equiseti]|uniref:Methyltransferase domain-containing protein n=1 Tax=Fusarium equiseti TaxID=61235 RepID=A0A8J2IVZ3_FUSEQ|nr:unnamed protein product [Fusarium equiseti]